MSHRTQTIFLWFCTTTLCGKTITFGLLKLFLEPTLPLRCGRNPVVKRPLPWVTCLFRSSYHALISRFSVSWLLIRRLRHCRAITPISILTMFNQLPCFGVQWISSRAAMQCASVGSKASYNEDSLCALNYPSPIQSYACRDNGHPLISWWGLPDQLSHDDLSR